MEKLLVRLREYRTEKEEEILLIQGSIKATALAIDAMERGESLLKLETELEDVLADTVGRDLRVILRGAVDRMHEIINSTNEEDDTGYDELADQAESNSE